MINCEVSINNAPRGEGGRDINRYKRSPKMRLVPGSSAYVDVSEQSSQLQVRRGVLQFQITLY